MALPGPPRPSLFAPLMRPRCGHRPPTTRRHSRRRATKRRLVPRLARATVAVPAMRRPHAPCGYSAAFRCAWLRRRLRPPWIRVLPSPPVEVRMPGCNSGPVACPWQARAGAVVPTAGPLAGTWVGVLYGPIVAAARGAAAYSGWAGWRGRVGGGVGWEESRSGAPGRLTSACADVRARVGVAACLLGARPSLPTPSRRQLLKPTAWRCVVVIEPWDFRPACTTLPLTHCEGEWRVPSGQLPKLGLSAVVLSSAPFFPLPCPSSRLLFPIHRWPLTADLF